MYKQVSPGRECEEYAKEVYQEEASPVLLPSANTNLVSVCGNVEVPLIVGGTKAKPKEFPHMARVGFGNEANISWSCGGSLISELYILTAAHCVYSKDKGPARWVRLEEEGEDSSHQLLSVAERVVHPDYKQPSRYNDIALLKMDREVTFNGFVRPACLHTKTAIPGIKGIATGYGRMEYASDATSKELMKVELSFIPMDKCNDTYKNDVGGLSMVSGLQDSQLCAGELQGGKDTCQGDSGGALQIVPDKPYCMYNIVGVTSFGKFCGFKNSPAIYTRVSHFIPWLEDIIWP
uniref:Peptidase S1 domain-containing protein n=1 Tax=Timema poppense TaxID=170557 RepID=A0A7R9CHX7_TIMPO|nr:unnamed protein product [Timema poppensis]